MNLAIYIKKHGTKKVVGALRLESHAQDRESGWIQTDV
jgi:hypothetical protein